MSSKKLYEASEEKTSFYLNFWNFQESSLRLHSAVNEHEKESSCWSSEWLEWIDRKQSNSISKLENHHKVSMREYHMLAWMLWCSHNKWRSEKQRYSENSDKEIWDKAHLHVSV